LFSNSKLKLYNPEKKNPFFQSRVKKGGNLTIDEDEEQEEEKTYEKFQNLSAELVIFSCPTSFSCLFLSL